MLAGAVAVLGMTLPAQAAVSGLSHLPAGAKRAATSAQAAAVAPVATDRLEGANRYLTAVKISRRAFPTPLNGSGPVYVARGDVLVDALAAGTLTGGPILLVPRCSAPPAEVVAEVKRLNPSTVIGLGSATCASTLAAVAGAKTTSLIAGPDRYATALRIADERVKQGPVTTVFLASGLDTAPDAVAGGALTDGPILTVNPAGGASVTAAKAWVAAHSSVKKVVALGGADVVPELTLAAVVAGVPNMATDRLEGPDRYATAAAIATYQFPGVVSTVYLARGDVFADAVAAGSLTNGPVLLTSSCSLSTAAKAAIGRLRPARVTALGGLDVLCDSTVAAAAAASPPGAMTAAAVSAGSQFTCAVTSGGGVKCWGDNRYGELGNGTTASSTSPVDVTGLTSGVAQVSAGSSHACALLVAGGVTCWGANGSGQLGNGTTASATSPVNVTGLTTGVTAISAGDLHTCALTSGGGVKCWGENLDGELGDGTTTSSSSPVDVSGLTSGVTAISVAGVHSCALTTGGGVKCWGNNLGNGTTGSSSTPVDVTGLTSGVAKISAGFQYTCAVTVAGGAKCWGDNYWGELGNGGQPTDSNVPVNVTGLTSGVTTVVAGSQSACAVTTAGPVMCWGDNSSAQFGDRTTASSPVPVGVPALSFGTSTVSVGDAQGCAITVRGLLACWGANGAGEVGDGTSVTRTSPVAVSGF